MKHLLLIECPDRVGLVQLISNVLAGYNLNIVAMREFVDEAVSRFFTRIECKGELSSTDNLYKDLREQLPGSASIMINPREQKRIVLLVTKEHHCLGDILVRNFFGNLNAEVCCVIGNYDHLAGFVDKFGIPFHHISHLETSKDAFEKEMCNVIDKHDPDYIVLAKFMRILSPEFISHFASRIINIHHSFLPAFIGANPYRKAFERGVKVIGATAHFVTNDLDEGPIIEQQTVHVNHTFGVSEMVISGREIERSVLNKALRLVFQDRIFISENKTVIFE
jgi:formyltetrahydrofolate deformylase